VAVWKGCTKSSFWLLVRSWKLKSRSLERGFFFFTPPPAVWGWAPSPVLVERSSAADLVADHVSKTAKGGAPGFFLDHQFGSGRTIGGRRESGLCRRAKFAPDCAPNLEKASRFRFDAARPDTEFRSRTFGKTCNDWNKVATEECSTSNPCQPVTAGKIRILRVSHRFSILRRQRTIHGLSGDFARELKDGKDLEVPSKPN
jgi:hypothetical protein